MSHKSHSSRKKVQDICQCINDSMIIFLCPFSYVLCNYFEIFILMANVYTWLTVNYYFKFFSCILSYIANTIVFQQQLAMQPIVYSDKIKQLTELFLNLHIIDGTFSYCNHLYRNILSSLQFKFYTCICIKSDSQLIIKLYNFLNQAHVGQSVSASRALITSNR